MKQILVITLVLISSVKAFTQNKDSIIAKWRWINDIESYRLRYRDILIEPLIINNVIFFNGSLYPYNISTGKALKYQNKEDVKVIKENCNDSILLFNEGDMVFIVDIYNGNVLYELTRKLRLKYPFITKPTIVKDNYCLFSKNDTTLLCYDYRKKSEIWNIWVPKKGKNQIYMESIRINDTVILATRKKIGFYNIANGNEIWNIPLESEIHGNIVLSAGVLYYITVADGYIHAYNIKKKEEIWKYSDYVHEDGRYGNGGGMSSNIVIENDSLFYACGTIAAMNKNTGKIYWTTKDVEINFLYRTQCVITNKYIITRERQDDIFPIVTLDKKTGNCTANSFGTAFMGESNVYSNKHKLFLSIDRKEGVSMRVSAWKLVND